MRYRAHTVGAQLDIDSAQGDGTRIRITLPRGILERRRG